MSSVAVRDTAINKAIADRKIPESKRDFYESMWEADPSETLGLLTTLPKPAAAAPVLVPAALDAGRAGGRRLPDGAPDAGGARPDRAGRGRCAAAAHRLGAGRQVVSVATLDGADDHGVRRASLTGARPAVDRQPHRGRPRPGRPLEGDRSVVARRGRRPVRPVVVHGIESIDLACAAVGPQALAVAPGSDRRSRRALAVLDRQRKVALYYALPEDRRKPLEEHASFLPVIAPYRNTPNAAVKDLDELFASMVQGAREAVEAGEPERFARFVPPRFRSLIPDDLRLQEVGG